jgi:phosphatidylglycerophosphate synthase
MMVSYTRARAEGLGVDCEIGIMQRTERVVYLGVFSILNYFANILSTNYGFKSQDFLLKFALILILLFSSYTTFQRMVYVMNLLKRRKN